MTQLDCVWYFISPDFEDSRIGGKILLGLHSIYLDAVFKALSL